MSEEFTGDEVAAMSYPADYKALVDDLRGNVGDTPEDLDWTEDLFARAADAVEALAAESESSVKRIYALLHERDELRRRLDRVFEYANDRAAYGRAGRTVGSLRIASDLFNILGVEHDWEATN